MKHKPNNTFLINLLKCSVEHINSNAKWQERDMETEWFQEEIYIPTRLDKTLLPDLLGLKYPLVFLAGTPGSGKTQFLKKLKIELIKNNFNTAVADNDSSVMATFQKDNITLHIKHDATQVEGEIDDASEKLGELLDADWSDKNFEKEKKNALYIIGINQGVLQRLCDLDGFQLLGQAIRNLSESKILIVDLSKRSAVCPTDHQDAFVTYLLMTITDKAYWENYSDHLEGIETCFGCELVEKSLCPILTNIRWLRKEHPWERIHDIFEMNHYISGNITTFRDVLAILGKSIAGYIDYYSDKTPCEYIRAEATKGDSVSLMNLSRLLIYNLMFSDQDPYEEYLNQLELSKDVRERHVFFGYSGSYFVSESDEIGSMVRLDPSRSDSDLLREQDDEIFNFPRKLLDNPDGPFENQFFQVIEKELKDLEMGETDDDLTRSSRLRAKDWLLYCLIRLGRRRFFLLGKKSCKELSQYEHADSFSKTIMKLAGETNTGYNRRLAGDIKIALSALSNAQASGTMKVSYGDPDSKITALLDFEVPLKVFLPESDNPYIEYFPREIYLAAFDEGDAIIADNLSPIKIDLEVWECLQRAHAGFIASYLGIDRAKSIEGFLNNLRSVAWDLQICKLEIKGEDANVLIYKDHGRPVIR